MPASLALATAGRIEVWFCASRIRTVAPFEMSVSTSVSCCSSLRLASASMYVPPPSSTVFLMLGWSCAAQRGCWQLFQETPTVHAAAALPAALPLALALGEALEQAARVTAAIAVSTASLRIDMLFLSQ